MFIKSVIVRDTFIASSSVTAEEKHNLFWTVSKKLPSVTKATAALERDTKALCPS